MASPLTERVLKSIKTDPETGCVGMSSDSSFQLCRQNYFLKQQNQILQSQEQNLKTEGNKIEAIIQEPVSSTTSGNFGEISTLIFFILIFFVVTAIQKNLLKLNNNEKR